MSIDNSSQSNLNTLAALVSGQQACRSIAKDDWPEMVSLAQSHKLGPALWWALKEEALDPAEEPRWEPLRRAAREAAVHYALLKDTQRQVESALVKVAIPRLWLKGIALANTVHPQPWARPMGDLDLLVPYEQRETTLAGVRRLGFQPPEVDHEAMMGVPEAAKYHYRLVGGAGGAVRLELHYRLLDPLAGGQLSPEQVAWFWSQAAILEGTDFSSLKPEAHLLYLCAHDMLRHGETYLKLSSLYDLHLLANQRGFNWDTVVERALDVKWAYAVARELSLCVDYFNTPVPEEVFTELRERRSSQEDIRETTRLQSQTRKWQNWQAMLAVLPPEERLKMVVTWIFPPKSYMRHLYGLLPGRVVLPYYAYRWLDAGQEMVRGIIQGLGRA